VVNELIETGLRRSASHGRTLGLFAGQITVVDNFDDHFSTALNEPVEP